MEEKTLTHWVKLSREPVSVDAAVGFVTDDAAGAVATFLGTVRAENEGRAVGLLEYSAYESMAIREMKSIVEAIAKEHKTLKIAVVHRLGALRVGDIAVAIAASSKHRGEAFAACRATIDRIKATVPIWKRETGPDGAAWVGWVDARCAPGHDASSHARHDGHSHD
jgi:molybdopterin synthase catalytic subunit